MVGNRKSEEVVDPKLPEMPASKALKRALLVALKCVDPDATKRPKMGHVIHMLEADDLLFRDVCMHHFFQTKNYNLWCLEKECLSFNGSVSCSLIHSCTNFAGTSSWERTFPFTA
jgi:hypothetical protein